MREDGLPTAEESKELLVAAQDALSGARSSPTLTPRPPPRRKFPDRRVSPSISEEIAAGLFLAGALLELAGDERVDRELLAREIIRRGRRREARQKARRTR